jgi:hypothetical protein
MIDIELENALGVYLQPGEKLLWTGRPARGLRTSPEDALMIPFSLFWGGFAIFWESMVFHSRAPVFFRLWGIPFVAVGLYFIVGRFFVDAWARGRTVYGVTNQRALVLRNIFSEQLISTKLDGDVRLKRESSGRGTLAFGPELGGYARYRGWGGMTPALAGGVRFIGIDDVMSVYKLVGARPSP